MAAPQVGGAFSGRFGATMQVSIDITSVPVGAWMIFSAMSSSSSLFVTPPAGWTTVVNRVVSGTRGNFLFAKIRAAEDGNAAVFTQDATNVTSYSLLWGVGSLSVNEWIIGTQWRRSVDSVQPSGSRYSNVAKSITTPTSEHLILAVSHEATLAMVQSNEISSINPAGEWTEGVWLPQVAVNDRIETIWIGSKELPTASSSGDVTLTYTSPQDNNGWTIQIAIPPAPVAIDAPYVVGIPTTYINWTSTGFSIDKPSGLINGDYVVAVLRGQSSTVTVAPSSPGFTRLGPAFVLSSSSFRMIGFYGHPVTDSALEPAAYTFSFTAGATNNRVVATAFIVRGVNIDNPLAGFHDDYGGTLITNGRQVEPYATDSVPILQLFAGSSEFAASNDHTPTSLPAGYSLVQDVVTTTSLGSSRSYLWVGSKTLSASPTSADNITWGVISGPAAESIALRAAASPGSAPEGLGYSMANGAGIGVRVYHLTAAGLRTPSTIIPMRRGFNNVTEMLATPGSTWAHRGGSASYPEMSLFAYTQCVARGYGVLEVSLGRTSDGVWFGLHDQTTDRTSGGTYGAASSQTWAQLQAQQIVIGAQGAPQPYMRWEEVVATYGSTHILVADPKYALGSYRTEFLNLVYSSVGTGRAIIKYSGAGSGAVALSTAAQAMGFETWGYFYATDASSAQGGDGNLQTWGPYWTIVGMEYGASQAIWDEALALGKPVIGHVAPNQAAYDMAIAKGASGVQVSGVGVVAPISWWTQ